jgi:hypothetical protein
MILLLMIQDSSDSGQVTREEDKHCNNFECSKEKEVRVTTTSQNKSLTFTLMQSKEHDSVRIFIY